MPIGIGCKIQILETKISNTRNLKKTAQTRYTEQLRKMRAKLKILKEQRMEQYEKKVTGLPSQKQLSKRKRVMKAKAKKN